MSINYKILALEFTSKGFCFKQVWREGDLAIYEKSKGNYKGFESIKIKRHDGYQLAGVVIEPAEMYPPSESWGVLAFTSINLKTAHNYIDKLKGVNIGDEQPNITEQQGKRGRPRKNK